ncbi:tetratricopeptide repeat protein [Oxynema aestuarii]|uniref:Tetratricopeptide repeat protein n=1 Tax=Oxynema aestuarii AP17 TaxID=2064643 RepID=A0A6H1U3W1_9CYAN|nr:tetratricopeptide repeat protein [Oxynema aestuarii]QIZ72309.1 tetratricopeptide repeat protein [Oxynema aestuarii AP17]
MVVTEIPSQKVLGSNRQIYKQLQLALKLGLRRQVFVAVCDDLRLRDRIVRRLETDLQIPDELRASQTVGRTTPQGPPFVSLQIDANHPNPFERIREWFRERDGSGGPLPSFQIVGVEHLTRATPAVQWSFLNGLEEIEDDELGDRLDPVGECTVLLWVSRPWCHTIEQSAPDFWRCRTGVFEFEGEPTPVLYWETGQDDRPRQQPEPQQPRERDLTPSSSAKQSEGAKVATEKGVWEGSPQEHRVGSAPEKRPSVATQTVGERQTAAIALKASQTGVEATTVAPRKREESQEQAIPTSSSIPDVLIELVLASAESLGRSGANDPEAEANGSFAPLQLLQQIEELHLQRADRAELAAAYLNLGNFYRNLLESGQIEQAIAQGSTANVAPEALPQCLMVAILTYEQVLQFLEPEAAVGVELANDLGNFYWMLSRYSSDLEEKHFNLERGIAAYRQGLKRIDPVRQGEAWGMIQNNLGALYGELARDRDPVENLEKSVAAYCQALEQRRVQMEAGDEQASRRYSATQNNLGTAYWNLAQHRQPARHLKEAIAAYQEALAYYSAEKQPLDYAMIQNNLGTAYWNLAQYEQPKDNLMLAIAAYQVALTYRTPEQMPLPCAATQNNLGTAYWHLANHSQREPEARAHFLDRAIAAYRGAIENIHSAIGSEEALSPVPIPGLPFDRFATYNNLGLAHYQRIADGMPLTDPDERSPHLEAALDAHLQALAGSRDRPELSKTALSYVVQTIRAFYKYLGIQGQNRALSKVPPHLLSEIVGRL